MFKVLILGWKIKKWKESKSSVQALGYNTYLAFRKMKEAQVYYLDKDVEDLPKVDFVILISYVSDNIDVEKVREKTGALKICALREYNEGCDFGFVFNPASQTENSYLFPPPCNKTLLKPTRKYTNSILVDHYWKTDYFGKYESNENDWTFKIENWLSEVKNKYEVYRLLRFPDEEKDIKDFEIPLRYTDYLNYLIQTARIETFIITHKDAYTYGIIDMAARGTRILSPEGFLPDCQIETFKIEIFRNRTEFFQKLRKPVNKKLYNSLIDLCIGFDEIAEVISNHFKKWLYENSVSSIK